MDRDIETTPSQGRFSQEFEWSFLGVCALLFIASVGVLIYWAQSMSGSMPMPGGWSIAMLWLGTPGQTWLEAAASFLGMWMVMMAAMMLPSLAPTLLAYRRSLRGAGLSYLAWPTLRLGAGYFFVWALFGAVAYPLGLTVTAAEMQSMDLARLAPAATGLVLLLAGCVQLTPWKARLLGHSQGGSDPAQPASAEIPGAWQTGLRHGVHCVLVSFNYMLIMLVSGVMDLGVMAILTAAITLERLVPKPERFARVSGVVIILVGIFLIARFLIPA